jgi:hypothetical protein
MIGIKMNDKAYEAWVYLRMLWAERWIKWCRGDLTYTRTEILRAMKWLMGEEVCPYQ